jgi:hypothetical protein
MPTPAAGMVLAPQEVVRYLLRRGLIGPATIVDGDLRIADTSRRNCNITVTTESGPSYLLKQGIGKHNAMTVIHEALIYRDLADLPGADGLEPYLARCHDFDAATGVLVLDLLPDAMNLREHAFLRRRCSVRLARELGRALAALHGCDVGPLRDRSDLSLSGEVPWALSADRPNVTTYGNASGGIIRAARAIQRYSGGLAALAELRSTWRPTVLIHGDMRWDNCLVHRRRPEDRSDLKLIDWEFASLGEPGWDIGSVLSEYLMLWLFSMPTTGRAAGEFLELSVFSPAKMQPASSAFWDAYVRRARLEPETAAALQVRSIRFAGVRLLHRAIEQVKGMNELDPVTVALLQLAKNVLDRPAAAGRHLLGLSTLMEVT